MPTAKILLVDANDDSRMMLAKTLTDAGYEVAVASSGSHAVSMLEWERPDLVMSYAQVDDMDGYELFSLVRKDPTTMDTPFLLLAGLDRPTALAAEEAGVDAVVTGEFTADSVVRRVGELVKLRAGEAAQRPATPDPIEKRKPAQPLWNALETAAARPAAPTDAAFQGSLDVMELAEVTQAIALGRKTGCLTVFLRAGEGSIYFETGRVVHAGFRGRTGEAAFADILSLSQRETDAKFRFDRMDRAEVTGGPKTISRSVEQLLLSIAVGIDEADPGAGSLQSASPARRADR